MAGAALRCSGATMQEASPAQAGASLVCQTFSRAGLQLGVRDRKGQLFDETMRLLRTNPPPVVVLENVPRLLTLDAGGELAVWQRRLCGRHS